MRKTGLVLLTIVLAMAMAPLRLPAASCILSNAPSEKACKSHCCANMACCAVSEKNKGLASPPLAQSAKQMVGLLATLPAPSMARFVPIQPIACNDAPARAHSPPPLVANCIRLI